MGLDFNISKREAVDVSYEDKRIIRYIIDRIGYKCDNVLFYNLVVDEGFSITHNLVKMAKQANIYKVLWYPTESGYLKANDIISKLQLALDDLLDRPEYFKQFDSENGYGRYNDLLTFIGRVLECCKNNPTAEIKACR